MGFLLRLLRRPLSLAVLALAAAAPAAAVAAFAPVPGNPANRLAALPPDPYAYDHAKRCTRFPRRGTVALQSWLQRHAGGVSWGIMRCERLSPRNFSLHAEGRALDWHLDAARPRDKREARRLIALLLAPDKLGTPHALARRMGIQEIIFDCRAWWSGSPGLGRYSPCYDAEGRRRRGVNRTLAHRDHIHFGLSRAGAAARTSFWAAGGARRSGGTAG